MYGIFSTIRKYAPNVFNALYCKFRLVRLCPVFTDPVTYNINLSLHVNVVCTLQHIMIHEYYCTSLRIIMKIMNSSTLTMQSLITGMWLISWWWKRILGKIQSASFDTHASEILDRCSTSVPPFPVVPLPFYSFFLQFYKLLVWFFLRLNNLLDHSFHSILNNFYLSYSFFLLNITGFTSTCLRSLGFCLTWTVGSSLE